MKRFSQSPSSNSPAKYRAINGDENDFSEDDPEFHFLSPSPSQTTSEEFQSRQSQPTCTPEQFVMSQSLPASTPEKFDLSQSQSASSQLTCFSSQHQPVAPLLDSPSLPEPLCQSQKFLRSYSEVTADSEQESDFYVKDPYFNEEDSDFTAGSEQDSNCSFTEMKGLDFSSESSDPVEREDSLEDDLSLKCLLEDYIKKIGAKKVAETLLENVAVRKHVMNIILQETHAELKSSLKKSRLVASKKDRNYLLTLTPRGLCEEFSQNAFNAFTLLAKGLLGISDVTEVHQSQFLLHIFSVIYSTVAKVINRKATGYALLLTTAARDGGLREDSIKLLSILVHPRTSQKYDKEVLAPGWNAKLKKQLNFEREHFKKIKIAEERIDKLCHDDADLIDIKAAKEELERLLVKCPPQLQLVWDNLNIRTKHRYEREGDQYSANNLDWMSSLWIQNRINSNHMDNSGAPLKGVENLSLKDMIPNSKEIDYVFMSLVHYFSHRLVTRHPLIFKAISRCIRPTRPHQFQKELDKKSMEFTGELFTKSESKTEDLITMMSQVQLDVHKFKDDLGVQHCYERKIVSGDNKTEKNMHYGILRKVH